jgi:hypothetical protein
MSDKTTEPYIQLLGFVTDAKKKESYAVLGSNYQESFDMQGHNDLKGEGLSGEIVLLLLVSMNKDTADMLKARPVDESTQLFGEDQLRECLQKANEAFDPHGTYPDLQDLRDISRKEGLAYLVVSRNSLARFCKKHKNFGWQPWTPPTGGDGASPTGGGGGGTPRNRTQYAP